MIIKSDPETITPYLSDQSGLNGAFCEKVYIPEDYQEVLEVLKQSYLDNLLITISGAGTGVTGGRLPFGGIVISLEKLNKVLEIADDFMVVQAGVSLDTIHKLAKGKKLIYPPDATEWNAFVGGNIATNASGARSFKYGATRKYIEEIKVALPDGNLLDIQRGKIFANRKVFTFGRDYNFEIPRYLMPEIKNAAGYFSKENMDLIDLFIGSEGTLGVILETKLRLLPFDGEIFSAFVFFDKNSKALDFVAELRNLDVLSIEYFDKNSLNLLRQKVSQIPLNKEAAIFFEKEYFDNDIEEALIEWLEILSKYKIHDDDIWATFDENKEFEFKNIRHELPVIVNEIVKSRGFAKVGTDIAVPLKNFDLMFSYYIKYLEESKIDYLIFGHIGDCHLHANILPKNAEEEKKAKDIYVELVKKAVSLGGTVSAEHGIGKLKHKFLLEMYGQKGIDEMIRVKKVFDPKLLINRGNIFKVT